MKFIDHDETLEVRLERCTLIKFDDNSQHGVRVEILQDGFGEPAAFLLTADQAIKFARGVLKLAMQAR